MLVVENSNKWYPIFMIIDDNKKANNIFNYKNLDLKHKTIENENWSKINFIGYKVQNNLLKSRLNGWIIEIIEKYENELPKYVYVKWEDHTITKEFVINSQEEINKNIKFYIDKNKNLILKEEKNILVSEVVNYLDNKYIELQIEVNNKNYNGKFKEEKRINWGASPGARASNQEIYFSKQRLYEVNQQIVSDYLNTQRVKKGLSKKQLTDLFPKNYRHTVGHWLRKDFGGSIPLPEDWNILKKYLELDENWTNYVCKTGLKIQTVKKGEYKLPKDFIEKELLNNLKYLITASKSK